MHTINVWNAPAIWEGEDDERLAAHLSASALIAYLGCTAKAYYSKIIKAKETFGADSLVGLAMHAAAACIWRRMAEGIEYTEADALVAAESILTSREAEAASADELAEVAAEIARMLPLVWTVARQMKPAGTHAIERLVDGHVDGVKVKAYVDLVQITDAGPVIVELKITNRSPSKNDAGEYEIEPNHWIQLLIYAELLGLERVKAVYLVRNKTPKECIAERTVTEADRRFARTLTSAIAASMRTMEEHGLGVVPNISSNICGPKYCSHVEACIQDFGGTR